VIYVQLHYLLFMYLKMYIKNVHMFKNGLKGKQQFIYIRKTLIFFIRFRLLLDELQMWNERAEFDIYRSHVNGTTPHRRQIFDRSKNLDHHFSCIFCQTPLEPHQGISSQTPTNVSLTANTNSTPIPTTPVRGQHRGSQQLATNRSSASSSSAYPPPPNSDMVLILKFLFFQNKSLII